jgi:hypothetical protein
MTYIERIHNIETGKIIERAYTEDEISQVKAAEIIYQNELMELQNKAANRQAVLDKLGLTADEAKALLG